MIRVFFEESRIPGNSVAGVSDGQTDQGDPLSDIEDVPLNLTEGSQSSRTLQAVLGSMPYNGPIISFAQYVGD